MGSLDFAKAIQPTCGPNPPTQSNWTDSKTTGPTRKPLDPTPVMVRHGKTGGSRQVWVGSIWLQVKWVTGQKRVILSGLKMGSCQSGCGLGQVDPYFSHDFFFFFFIKKTTCIFHLKSYGKKITWCKMHYFVFTTYIKNELS